MHTFLFYNKFVICLYMFRALITKIRDKKVRPFNVLIVTLRMKHVSEHKHLYVGTAETAGHRLTLDQ